MSESLSFNYCDVIIMKHKLDDLRIILAGSLSKIKKNYIYNIIFENEHDYILILIENEHNKLLFFIL